MASPNAVAFEFEPSSHAAASSSAPPPPSSHQCIPARYRLAWLCFAAAFFGYAQRYGLALAIVRMQVDLDWNRSTQGQVLAAFFLGYMVAQLPAGYVAAHLGPRRSIAIGMAISSLLTLLLPPAAMLSPWAVMGVRVIQGLAQGILFPGFASLWSQWAPPMERSRLDGIPRAGGFCGGMAVNAIGGWQCETTLLSPWLFGGWQGVFSLWGVLGLFFAVVWYHLVADSPSVACSSASWQRRTGCTPFERDFIHESLGQQLLSSACTASDSSSGDGGSSHGGNGSGSSSNGGSGGDDMQRSAAKPPPFRMYLTIARSPAVWAITLAHTLNDGALYMLDDGLPPYLRDVHGLDLSRIGVLLGINGALKPLTIVTAAVIADRLRRCMRTLHVRKLITSIAFVPQATFLLCLAAKVLDTPMVIAPLLLVVAPLNVASNGGGYAVNHLDIAPSLAPLVLAFYNMGGQVHEMQRCCQNSPSLGMPCPPAPHHHMRHAPVPRGR